MRALKWAGIVVFCSLAIGLSCLSLGIEAYQKDIQKAVSQRVYQSIQRDLTIEGGFHFKLTPRPTLVARGIQLENAKWATHAHMLTVKEATVALSYRALLRGDFEVAQLTLDTPVMRFENKNGASNWQFNLKKSTGATYPELAERLMIKNATIENGRIDIAKGAQTINFKIDAATGTMNRSDKYITVHAKGQTGGKNLEAVVYLDNLKTILTRQPSQVKLVGRIEQSDVRLNGEINDVMAWSGLNLELSAELDNLQTLQPFVKSTLPRTPALHASATFKQPKRWASAELNAIKATSTEEFGRVSGRGRIGNLAQLKDFDLKGDYALDSKALLTFYGLKPSKGTPINGDFSLTGATLDDLSLGLNAKATPSGAALAVSGTWATLTSKASSAPLKLKATASNINDIAPYVGDIAWPVLTGLSATANLVRANGGVHLEDITANSTDYTSISALGSIKNLGPNLKGNIQLKTELTAKDIAKFNADNAWSLPSIEQLNFNSNLALDGVDSHLDDLSVIAYANEMPALEVNGTLRDLRNKRQLDASVTVKKLSTADLEQLFSVSIPVEGSYQGTAKLTGNANKNYDLTAIELKQKGENYSLHVSDGTIKSLGPLLKADLPLQLKAESLSALQLGPLLKSNPKGLIAGSARLKATSATKWQLKALDLNTENSTGALALSGEVSSLFSPTQLALTVKTEAFQFSDWLLLPAIDDFKFWSGAVHFNTSDLFKNGIALETTSFEGRSRATSVIFKGGIGNALTLQDFNLSASANAKDASQLNVFQALDLATGSDFKLNADITGDTKQTKVVIHALKLGKTALSADITAQLPTKTSKLKISGLINSPYLDLRTKKAENAGKFDSKKKMFSNEALNLTWIKQLELDLVVTINELLTNAIRADQLKAKLDLSDNRFRVDQLQAKVGAGQVEGNIIIDYRNSVPDLIATITGNAIDPNQLGLFQSTGFIKSGTVRLDAALTGSGVSLHDIMSSSYGKALIKLENMVLHNKALEFIGSDIIMTVLDTLNPLRKNKEDLSVDCGVIHFPVFKGLAQAHQGIALKTRDITVLGGGAINLDNEQLKMVVRLKPRRGLGLSASSVAKLMAVGGSLSKPKIEIDKIGLLETTASIGAAVATGGWTLLAEGLFNRTQANAEVCQQTLAKPNFNNTVFNSQKIKKNSKTIEKDEHTEN